MLLYFVQVHKGPVFIVLPVPSLETFCLCDVSPKCRGSLQPVITNIFTTLG